MAYGTPPREQVDEVNWEYHGNNPSEGPDIRDSSEWNELSEGFLSMSDEEHVKSYLED